MESIKVVKDASKPLTSTLKHGAANIAGVVADQAQNVSTHLEQKSLEEYEQVVYDREYLQKLTVVALKSVLAGRGWKRASIGVLGELWKDANGRMVGIPHGVTQKSFEWKGVIDRVHTALTADRKTAEEQGKAE